MSPLLFSLALLNAADLTYRPTGMGETPAPVEQRVIAMRADPEAAARLPGWKAPLFGEVAAAGRSWRLASEDEKGAPVRLVCDRNGNGRLDDDEPQRWTAESKLGWVRYVAAVDLKVGRRTARVLLVRIGGPAEIRAMPDYGYLGTAAVGGRRYPAALVGDLALGAKVWLDRNGDGKRQSRAEVVPIGTPFNFGGGSYELAVSGAGLRAVPSKLKVRVIPMPPDLSVGQRVPRFELTAPDGTKIAVPASFKGKIVLLDFWATWCPACVEALPEIGRTLRRFGDKGFDVVSVSLDEPGARAQMEALMKSKGLFWTNVFDGLGWKGPIVDRLGIESLPLMLLIDGDTGEILAREDGLGLGTLEKTVEEVLRKRGRISVPGT